MVLKVSPDVADVMATEPLTLEHVGWVTLSVGADGDPGCAPIVPVAAGEIHPAAFLALMLYAAPAAMVNGAVYAE